MLNLLYLSLSLNATPLPHNPFSFHVNPNPYVCLLSTCSTKVTPKVVSNSKEEEEDETTNIMGKSLCVKRKILEEQREFKGIELIASENLVFRTNTWGVNVQPYYCPSAKFAVFTCLLHPQDRIIVLDLISGGHLSHGYCSESGKRVSAAPIFFETLSYKVNPQTVYINYEKVEEKVLGYRPRILVCGGSSNGITGGSGRGLIRVGLVLMCDMAHISGLVAEKDKL